jgi:hypothetical protein
MHDITRTPPKRRALQKTSSAVENLHCVSPTAFLDSAKRARFAPVQGCGVDVSQFSSVLLLVITLTLTVCVGVAAWRTSGDTSEVTGSIVLSDPR